MLISTTDAEVSPEQRERIERERGRWMAVHRAESEEGARQAVADDPHGAERLKVAAAMTTAARPGESREHAQHRNVERGAMLRRAAAAQRASAGQAVVPPSVRRTAPRARGAGSPAGRAVARSTSRGGDSGDDGSGSSEGDPEPPGALEATFGRSLFHRLARWLRGWR